MKKLLVCVLAVSAMAAQAASSFNEVRDVVFSPANVKSSLEQQEVNVYLHNQLPHYQVTAANFIKDGINLLKADAERTLNDTADYYPRLEKRLHSNGICLTGTWHITQKTPYTGYFKQGAQGLIIARASTALSETERGEPRAFGMAGKLFPTLDADAKVNTMNFFTVDVLAGTQRDHYLDVKMTNEPKTGFRFAVIPLAFQVGRIFTKADEQAGFRPVNAIGEAGLKQGEVAKSPRYFMLQGTESNVRNQAVDFRDELNIEKNHAGKPLIFKILVSDSSGNQDSKDWQAIGELRFNESKVSYGCDRRLHFAHPKIKK